MKFNRVSGNPNKVLPNSFLGDHSLDDQGYLWWYDSTTWQILRRITKKQGKLIDVQGEPTLHQGENDDVAVTPRGKCWLKQAEAWQYEEDLGEGCESVTRTETLVVLGNLSLPIVNGRIPLFDSIIPDKVVGCLVVMPLEDI